MLRLIVDSLKLSALESGGVDNWSYYNEMDFDVKVEVLSEFLSEEEIKEKLEDTDDISFEDCARYQLRSYTQIK